MDPLARASAALASAIFASREGRASVEPGGAKTLEKSAGKSGNFILSPFSVLLVLAVVMRGARGPTLREMERLLPSHMVPGLLRLTSSRIPPSSGEAGEVAEEESRLGTKSLLKVFSSLYLDAELAENRFFQKFTDNLMRECSAGDTSGQLLPVRLVDFTDAPTTAKTINSDVCSATSGRITDLVSSSQIHPQTRLVVLSAAFFKGAWINPFSEAQTDTSAFYALLNFGDDETATQEGAAGAEAYPGLVKQEVLTMHILLEPGDHYYFYENKDITAVGLPYVDQRFVMYVVRPHDTKNLERLLRVHDDESGVEGFPTFGDVVQLMREGKKKTEEVEVLLSLPKFTLKAVDNYLDLIPIFQRELGIRAPFDSRLADFSGISGDKSLVMSAFVHQAEIEVDEKGTTASAATFGGIAPMSYVYRERVDLTIDSPFLFQIWYHGSDGIVAHEEEAAGGAAAPHDPLLRDHVLFSGCVTDVSAAQQ